MADTPPAGDSVPANDDTTTTTTTTGDTATPTTERTFSQADVDRIVQDRLARQKAQFAGYDEFKTKAEQFDQLQEASKTELQKALERAEAAEKARDEYLTEAKETRLKAAILAEAAKADRKIVDPEAVLKLLDRATLELDDDGVPTNIAQAMDSLLEQRPYLVAVAGGARAGSADQGARGGGADQLAEADLKSMTPEQIVKAHEEGRFKSLLGAS